MNTKEFAEKLKEAGAVKRGNFTLKSGEKSNLYIDLKRVYGYPNIINIIADKVVKKVDKEANCIATSGYGGVPLGTLVSQKAGIQHLALVRDKKKDHGTSQKIDGYIPNRNDTVVIVDDVLMRGTQICSIATALKETGAVVLSAIVVVKRGDPQFSFPVKYLLKEDDLT